MNILLVLIPISLVLLGIAIWALVWAVRRGQFDDLDTPAVAMLADDDLTPSAGERRPPAPVGQTAPDTPARTDDESTP